MRMRSIASVLPVLCLTTSIALGDGGTVRWSGVSGPYRVAVLTSPEPLRVGAVDVSVVVSDAHSGVEIRNARVAIQCAPPGRAGSVTCRTANRELSPTKLYQMASFDLDSAGQWGLEIEIDAPLGRARVTTELIVSPAMPRWIDLAGWILLPLLPITLFTAREVRRSRRVTCASR